METVALLALVGSGISIVFCIKDEVVVARGPCCIDDGRSCPPSYMQDGVKWTTCYQTVGDEGHVTGCAIYFNGEDIPVVPINKYLSASSCIGEKCTTYLFGCTQMLNNNCGSCDYYGFTSWIKDTVVNVSLIKTPLEDVPPAYKCITTTTTRPPTTPTTSAKPTTTTEEPTTVATEPPTTTTEQTTTCTTVEVTTPIPGGIKFQGITRPKKKNPATTAVLQ